MPEIKKQIKDASDKIDLTINGMTCDHCAVTIEKIVKRNAGVKRVAINYKNGKGKIEFNPEAISKDEIINAINSSKTYLAKLSEATTNGDRNAANHQFDLIIIGGGSAAFSAAITAENLGLTTLMVNAGLPFGGTCVNVGCVPSKTLIRAAETAYHATHSNFSGIKPKGFDINFAQVIKDKKQLVKTLQQKKYMDVVSDFQHLQMVEGRAEFVDDKTILVNGKDTYTAIKFIISTGATTNVPDIEGLKEIGYFTNVSLFDLEEQPESITIMGAGYIGLEIAMAYNRFGTKVRVIEFTDRVLRTQTPDISEEIEKHMKNEGVEILPNFRAVKFQKSGSDTIIHCKCPDGSLTQLVEPGKIVVATGIKANTQKLGLDKIGLQLTQSGHVQVNELMETNLQNIYAIGDVANTPSFVYTAAF